MTTNDSKLHSPPPGTWGVITELNGKWYGVCADWTNEDCPIFVFHEGDWVMDFFRVWQFGSDMYNALEMIILCDYAYEIDKSVIKTVQQSVGRCEFVSSFLKPFKDSPKTETGG